MVGAVINPLAAGFEACVVWCQVTLGVGRGSWGAVTVRRGVTDAASDALVGVVVRRKAGTAEAGSMFVVLAGVGGSLGFEA